MSIEICEKGQLMRLSMNFKDDDSVDVDPTTVTLTVIDPSGNSDTYTYALSQIERENAGDYFKEIEADEEGDWHFRWVSTGTGQGATEGQFVVLPSQF